jgi:hypothetical protein
MAIQKLLFVDTNIWLDFYRARNEINLEFLQELEKIEAKIIVTYQLETEFKKNRQSAILEGFRDLKAPTQIPRLGIFSDLQATKKMGKMLRDLEQSVKKLKVKLQRVLTDPAANDPVYQACQRIFHRDDALVLTRENPLRHAVRRRALKRFLHGCPPRKDGDTSIGDAINWEWMVHCAKSRTAELVIVSRDSDYGVILESGAYINDHLRQEFSERVSRKRKLLLYTKLSDALKHFKIPVSPQAKKAESDLVQSKIGLEVTRLLTDWTKADFENFETAFTAKLKENMERLSAIQAERSKIGDT